MTVHRRETISLWRENTEFPPRPALNGQLNVDVAVIGAGLAGCLTAYRLQRTGLRVALLERYRVGHGQTGNTTAKITAQHGLFYARACRQLGRERAALYARCQQDAIQAYCALIREQEIDCDWRELPSGLYSTLDGEPLRQEAQVAAELGLPATFSASSDLPFPVRGLMRLEGQATFHPLKFLRAIAAQLDIYEQTPALTVDDHEIRTEGGVVRAERIVFASHYPFVNVPGWYFARLHQERSYVLALEQAPPPEGMYLGIDQDGLSFRPCGELLLLGGGQHRSGENREGGKYEFLRQQARRLWPDCRELTRWSAQDCITPDHIPFIGRYAALKPNWYVATGFNKWGMTNSMVAAQLLTDLIRGQANAAEELFSPQRLELAASAANLGSEAKHALSGLGKTLFSIPAARIEQLPPGHGGVVETDQGKAGVCKDLAGNSHIVSVRCPHLGCQLAWNPDERSWDCPCHGSRFSKSGQLLNGPAQENLHRLD